MIPSESVTKPLRSVGEFFAMSLDTFVAMFKLPFAWREFLLQTWFVARVSIIPTLLLTIPFTVLVVFTMNILLVEFGAADFSGTGAATASVTQIGPVVTVLVVAGTGATAMCADLGARAIHDELDALRVMGVDPFAGWRRRGYWRPPSSRSRWFAGDARGHGRVLLFSVFVQHVTPGAFAAGLTLLTHLPDSSWVWSKGRCSGWPPL